MRQLVHHEITEARRLEHLPRRLGAPHGTEAGAAGGERNGHAVQAGHGVEKRRKRVRGVEVYVARSSHLLDQEDSSRTQGAGYARDHVARAGLVVDRIEGRDEIEARLRAQVRDVLVALREAL